MKSWTPNRLLSPRQAEALAFVAERVRGGLAPSDREVATHLGVMLSRAQHHLRRLVVLGHLTRGNGSRTTTLRRGLIVGASGMGAR